MPGHAFLLAALLLGGTAFGYAEGAFSITLGSFVIWGFTVGVTRSRTAPGLGPQVMGPIYAMAYVGALLVFLTLLVTGTFS